MARIARDRDRALQQGTETAQYVEEGDETMNGEDGTNIPDGMDSLLGSNVVIIQPGSQNLRIGIASDVLPKTVPMVVARKQRPSNAGGEAVQPGEAREASSEPKPKRRRLGDGEPYQPDESVWHPCIPMQVQS